jgi:hypothetical protein
MKPPQRMTKRKKRNKKNSATTNAAWMGKAKSIAPRVTLGLAFHAGARLPSDSLALNAIIKSE